MDTWDFFGMWTLWGTFWKIAYFSWTRLRSRILFIWNDCTHSSSCAIYSTKVNSILKAICIIYKTSTCIHFTHIRFEIYSLSKLLFEWHSESHRSNGSYSEMDLVSNVNNKLDWQELLAILYSKRIHWKIQRDSSSLFYQYIYFIKPSHILCW